MQNILLITIAEMSLALLCAGSLAGFYFGKDVMRQELLGNAFTCEFKTNMPMLDVE